MKIWLLSLLIYRAFILSGRLVAISRTINDTVFVKWLNNFHFQDIISKNSTTKKSSNRGSQNIEIHFFILNVNIYFFLANSIEIFGYRMV